MVILENELLVVTINPVGAELSGIHSKVTGKEYLWNADPKVWASHAPVLFPIIGALKNNTYSYKGKEYQLPKHGFIRNNSDVQLISQTSDSATFGLSTSETTLLIYPFQFQFRITYSLQGYRLVVEHEVVNEGQIPLLFSLGAHPGFRCPVNENEVYEDYYIEFEKEENEVTWELAGDGLVSDVSVPVLHHTRVLPLHSHIFDKDALILKNLKSKKVSLRSKKSTQSVTVYFSDFAYLGIWAKPNSHFVCIEPWLGIADSWNTDQNFETKEGILSLPPQQTFEASYTIRIEE